MEIIKTIFVDVFSVVLVGGAGWIVIKISINDYRTAKKNRYTAEYPVTAVSRLPSKTEPLIEALKQADSGVERAVTVPIYAVNGILATYKKGGWSMIGEAGTQGWGRDKKTTLIMRKD